jgi:hypothetical protein
VIRGQRRRWLVGYRRRAVGHRRHMFPGSMFQDVGALTCWRHVCDHGWRARVNSGHRLPARAGWYRARGKVRLGDRRTYLGPAKGAGQDVIRGETCQGFTTEEGFEPLPRYFAAGLEFGSSDGQGDGAPQRFRGGFHFAGIQRPHAGQPAVFESVGSAGGLIEEFAGTVPELSDDLHGLPIDVVGEHESTVGVVLTEAGSMLL